MAKETVGSRVERIGEELKESAHEVWLAGLGALRKAKEEGGRVFDALVEGGREVEKKGWPALESLRDQARELFADIRSRVTRAAEDGKKAVRSGAGRVKQRGARAVRAVGKEATAVGTRIQELSSRIEEGGAAAPKKPRRTVRRTKGAVRKGASRTKRAVKGTTRRAGKVRRKR